MPRKYLTPNISDLASDVVGRFFFIPENLLSLFSGAVQELCYSHNFEQFGSASPEETAQVFTDVLSEPMDSPVGMIVFYAGAAPPAPYILPCNGATYQVSDYPRLAASGVVVVTGDTFTVPNYRDRFLLGASPAYPYGSTGGESAHRLTIDELPPHSHEYTPPVANVDLESPGAPDILAAGVGLPAQTGNTGLGQYHNNMPPYVAVGIGIVAK